MLFSNADEVRFVKAGFEITMSFRARMRIKIFHWKFFREYFSSKTCENKFLN